MWKTHQGKPYEDDLHIMRIFHIERLAHWRLTNPPKGRPLVNVVFGGVLGSQSLILRIGHLWTFGTHITRQSH